MREIKFRAWDTERREMAKVIAWEEDGEITLQDSKGGIWKTVAHYIAVVMQYTGLTDKNGTEIFEGDVVAANDYTVTMLNHWGKETEEKISLYEIRFFEGRYMLFDKSNWVAVLNHHVMSKADQLTVVGNIYENPELLEVTE